MSTNKEKFEIALAIAKWRNSPEGRAFLEQARRRREQSLAKLKEKRTMFVNYR